MMRNLAKWPVYDDEMIDAVGDVLRSGKVNYWTGEIGQKFEKDFAQLCDADYAIACSNGSVALDLCLEALSIGSANGGTILDEVIVTPRSFIASASAIARAGARAIFADIDPVSQNITPRTVRPRINDRTKAILCVHLAGWPCDMDGFRKLTETRDLALIEDCAQAHGARFGGRSVGGLGDVAAWSFCQDKIMTTGGEGGAVTTNRADLYERLWALKDHGKNRNRAKSGGGANFLFLHDTLGTNARMTEMQAALGRIQTKRLPQWHNARVKNALAIEHALSEFAGPDGPLRISHFDANGDTAHAYYRYYAFLRPENLRLGYSRETLIETLQTRGVPVQVGICPEIYREAAFQPLYRGPRLPIAKLIGETSIAFATHPNLSAADLDYICDIIRVTFAQATKIRYYKSA